MGAKIIHSGTTGKLYLTNSLYFRKRYVLEPNFGNEIFMYTYN